MADGSEGQAGSGAKGGRKRKHPKNTEWRGDLLWGRKRIKGKLRRWSLRTGDVELARQRVEEDIQRMMAAVYYSDTRVKYEDIVASWAERHITHEVGPNAAKRYAVSLRQLEPFLIPAGASLFLDEIDRAKVDEIVTARRAAGVTTATIRRDLTALSSVFTFADVDSNPALDRLKRLKERRDPIVLPAPPHIEMVIRRAPGQMGALIGAAWRTGCRLDELVTAERSRLDHNRKQLTVIGKGNKLRVIDLDFGGAYDLLRSIPPFIGCRWLFWRPVTGEGDKVSAAPFVHMSSRFYGLTKAVLRTAQRAAKEAGHDEPDFEPFRFHDLRHRHAVDWLKAGRSIYDLQQRLGHSSIGTTEIYLQFLTPEEKRAVMYGTPAAERDREGA